MDFAVSEKMQTILGMIDEFVDKELIPMEPEFMAKPARSLLPAIEEKRKMVKQMELWAPNHPPEYGGIGLDLIEHALVSEALGRRQYVQLVGRGLVGVDAKNGAVLWNYNRIANDIANISMPVVRGEYVFSSTGYGTGAALVKSVRAEDGYVLMA